MISKEFAIKLAKEFMEKNYPLDDDEYIIRDEYTQETDDAWIFQYNSRKFIELNDPQYLIMIHLPLYVYKESHKCELFGYRPLQDM